MLKSHLRQLNFYDTQIAELDQEIARRLGVQTDPEDPDPKGGELTSQGNHAQTADLPTEAVQSSQQQPARQEPSTRLSSAQVIGILDEVTGINQGIAHIVVAELGTQLDQFPSEAQLVSWAGLCPAAKISAGKRLSTKAGKGNRWLRQALIEAAHGAARSKDTFLGAYYQRRKQAHGEQESHRGPGSPHLDHSLSLAEANANPIAS